MAQLDTKVSTASPKAFGVSIAMAAVTVGLILVTGKLAAKGARMAAEKNVPLMPQIAGLLTWVFGA